jgi:hypothetical protein
MDAPHAAPNPKRVLLFFPVFHSVLPAAFQNFMRICMTAVRCCPQYAFDPWIVARSLLHGAMNQAVDIALQQGHEYLIAFDDDCLPELPEFKPGDNRRWQVLPRLLTVCDEQHPIVSGVGYMRGFPHTTTIGRNYPWGTSLVLGETEQHDCFKGFYWMDDVAAHLAECDANGLLKVDFCGVPIICIHRSVLEKVPKPLFETRDEGGGSSTHDIYFCNKARAAGFDVHVDTHIDCGHIIESPIINKFTKAEMQRTLKSAEPAKELAHG